MVRQNNSDHLEEHQEERLRFKPLIAGRDMVDRWKERMKRGSAMLMEEYYGWYSQYTRNRIGAISLSVIHDSVDGFTSLLRKHTKENEVDHLQLLF